MLGLMEYFLQTRSKAEGYVEGATTLFNQVPISRFFQAANFVEVLQEASEFIFDDDTIKNHRLTTEAIVENCKDIKVLGRKDLRQLLTWRKNVKADLQKVEEKKEAQKVEEATTEVNDDKVDEEDEMNKLQQQILEMKTEQARKEKRNRKRKLKEKKKLEEKIRLRSVIPGDSGPMESAEIGLFNLLKMNKVQNIDTVLDQEMNTVLSESEDEEKEGPTYIRFEKDERRLDRTGRFYMGKDDKEIYEEKEEEESDEEEGLGLKDTRKASLEPLGSDYEDEGDEVNPLLTDLVGDSYEEKKARKAENWFSQDVFQNLETEADEDYELGLAISKYEKSGGTLLKKLEEKEKKEPEGNESGYTTDNSYVEKAVDAPDTDSESNSDSESKGQPVEASKQMMGGVVGKGFTTKDKKRKSIEDGLDPVGLALATKMIHSKKAKRDIMDAGWNRFVINCSNFGIPPRV
ncbi:pre-rRNA 2'-O-ribose RNA methyltransferase FTSJ3-like [Panulirus ornatus]|uniref:pre-rRNA 2'-O-ribose RNA methyltransferase FTSJ3-like n=1 Tax=Panulirus ornatus TaxID=150431 RepID=UPI003A8A52AC